MEADAGCVPGHGVRRGRDDPGAVMRRERKTAGPEMLQVRLRILRAMGTPCPSDPDAAEHTTPSSPLTGIIPFLISKTPMCRRINPHAVHEKPG